MLNFTKDQYQAYNQNWTITQSPDLAMLFGNSAGLLEFNGSNWRTNPLPNRQIIRSVASDGHGRIFTGAYGEFGFWQRDNSGHFIYQSLNSIIKDESFQREEIWHIVPLSKSIIFQSFSAIYLYDYQTVTPLRPPGNIMFAQPVHNKLLLPVIGQGLFELRNNSFERVPGTEALSDKTVVCLLPNGDNSFLIGTSNHGIFEYRRGQLRPWGNNGLQRYLIANQLNKGIRLANGNLALGTILNGVFVVNSKGEVLYHINQQNGLQNNTVLALFEDAAHNLWIGLDKGIDLIELSSPLTFFKDKSGTVGAVYAAEIYGDNLYIGSNQGVFVKSWQDQSKDNRFRLVNGTQGQVWQIQNFDGELLVGHNNGTFVIEGNQVRQISEITGGWITLPHPTKPDVLIQGTYTGLVIFVKNPNGGWQFAHRVKDFIEPVKKMMFDDQGNIWAVGPYRGLYQIQMDDSLQRITTLRSFTAKDGLSSEFKIDIAKLDGQIVIKSNSSFLTFDHKSGKLHPLDNKRMPKGNFRIKKGRDGEWFQIDAQQITYHHNNRHTTFNLPLVPDYESIISLQKDNYLLGLDDGYAIFTPGRDDFGTGAPLLLPAVTINAVASLGRNAQRFHPIGTEFLQLPATENNLRFRFSQAVFTRTPEFSYKLEGFDQEWSEWQSITEKEFNRLPPGNYIFKVRSRLSPDVASFRFRIQPHWYQTRWASILYVVAIALVIWLVEHWNQHRLEKQRLHLEAEKEKQLEEERIKVTNERLRADVINKSKELANSTMNLIQKNEILLQIKDEIQAIRSSADGHLPGKHYQRLLHLIDTNISSEQDWQVFETNFNQVHEQFFKKLKAEFPDLTPGDLKLAAYLKMNLSSKEIAPLLNISIRSVENKRYRLRKKLNLSEEDNLTEFMLQY